MAHSGWHLWRRSALGVALLLALGSAADARAQQATEQFIPIGSSPAVRAGHVAAIGRITRVDPAGHRVEITGPEGVLQFGVVPSTYIWLDRSEFQRPAIPGSFADCQTGRLAEVRVTGPEGQREAVWLKIAAEHPEDATSTGP